MGIGTRVPEPLTPKDALQRRAHALALAQGGVVRREQLHELGLQPRALRRWIGAGGWQVHGRKVLVMPAVRDGLLLRSLIVAQQVGPGCCLTGPSALAVRGMLESPPWDALRPTMRPWVINPKRVDTQARVIRRACPSGSSVLGVNVASDQIVLLDLLRFLPNAEAVDLAYRASGQARWAPVMRNLGVIAEEFEDCSGVVQLRRLTELLGTGARSLAERRVHTILRQAGIEGWIANLSVTIRGRRIVIDVAFPECKLAIEVDGRAYHGDSRFEADRWRHNLLESDGWRVLHITWRQITESPEAVLNVIRAALSMAQQD